MAASKRTSRTSRFRAPLQLAQVRASFEPLEDRRMLYALSTGTGDGSLTVSVDGYGSFGSAVGISDSDGAIYDPIGPLNASETMFQSGVAFRTGSSGPRQFLTSGDIFGSGGLPDPTITGTADTATSNFSSDGFDVVLVQAVSPVFDSSGNRTGAVLTQTYRITNTNSTATNLELLRFIDAHLFYDGSVIGGGGRLVTAGGSEFLFETDSGDGQAGIPFVGIDATGGTVSPIGRYQVDQYSTLGTGIVDGVSLTNEIVGDFDGNGFVDLDSEYDVTLALRNQFNLGAGTTVNYVTRTVYGSGRPTDIVIQPLIEFGPDVTQREGDSGITPFVFTVKRNVAGDTPVTATYATANGTATAGSDYQATSGTITFNPGGPATQLVTVNVLGDATIEPEETFFLVLTSVSSGVLTDRAAVGHIVNDDIDLSINDITVIENNTGTKNAVFTVSALGTTNQPITFSYTTINGTAAAAVDYQARSGTVTLPAGTTQAQVTITLINDALDEGDETFGVLLTNSTNARIADNLGIATITDNDPLPWFYVSDVQFTTTATGIFAAVFDVGLDVPSGREIVVRFDTADGSAINGLHYAGQSGVLTFGAGVTTRQVSIPVFSFGEPAPNRTFHLLLSGQTFSQLNDAQGTATIVYGAGPSSNQMIVDNGGVGFSKTGTWTNQSNTLAYQLDFDYANPGNGSATATWAFTGIPHTTYEVFTRWTPFSNRATNAPYTVLDGTTTLATIAVNQQVAPAGAPSEGVVWQSLGFFTVNSGQLSVRLGNSANGFVIADAVRIVSGTTAAPSPEIDVAGYQTSIGTGDVSPSYLDGTDFGEVAALTGTATHKFTIANHGSAPLNLTGTPRVAISGVNASEFTVVSPPAAQVAPGGETSFEVLFKPTGTGARTAVLTIASDDSSEASYQFVIQGVAIGSSDKPLILDDDLGGFSSNWTILPDAGAYQDQMRTAASGAGAETATWEFFGLAPGSYDIYTTWVPLADRATNAPFSVSNLVDHSYTTLVNQRLAPGVFIEGGYWSDLGSIEVTDGSLRIALSNNANGLVVADAVLIVPSGFQLPDPPSEPPALPLAHNTALPQDVNGDNRVSGHDALLLINRVMAQSAAASAVPLAAPLAAAESTPSFFVDVNGDGKLSPHDLLMVVNYLMRQSAAPKAAPLAAPLAASNDDGAAQAVAVDLALSQLDDELGSELAAGLSDPVAMPLVRSADDRGPSLVPLAALLSADAIDSLADDSDDDESAAGA